MTITLNRRDAARLVATALAAAGATTPLRALADDEGERVGLRSGKLFISTNAPAGNEVLIYARSSGGPAALVDRVSTHGLSTGGGLGSQGAVTLSGNGRWLFVVNAASNSISTFELHGQVL